MLNVFSAFYVIFCYILLEYSCFTNVVVSFCCITKSISFADIFYPLIFLKDLAIFSVSLVQFNFWVNINIPWVFFFLLLDLTNFNMYVLHVYKWSQFVLFVSGSSFLSLYVSEDTLAKERKTVKLLSCLTLCDPMDCSLPDSSIHGIFQARVL